MNDDKMKVTIEEQDIFNYIFFPDQLNADKKNLIESDKTFQEPLEFYKALKQNSEKEPSSSLRKKIALKIPAYKLTDVVELYPLKESYRTNQNGFRLAAASKELTPKMTTRTFVDKEKDYVIKVLNYSNETKVFVFSTKDEVVKDFDIIIEPQNLKYHFEDNSEPLVIPHLVAAEKIQLKFS